MNATFSPDDFTAMQRIVLARAGGATPPSRLEIAHDIGVSPQTLTRAVRPLLDADIITETASRSGQPGPPRRQLRHTAGRIAVLGLVIGQAGLTVSIEDLAGNVLYHRESLEPFDTPAPVLARCAEMGARARASIGADTLIVGAGVAAQGFFLERGRRVVSRGAPADWAALDLRAALEQRLGLPVTVQNDARAIAAGALRLGLCAPYRHAFCLYLANGIGGAFVTHGRVWEGAHGNAGEIGALVPDTPARPTQDNFCRAAGLDAPEQWPGFAGLGSQRAADLETWCVQAGTLLSPALNAAVALFDIDAILMFSALPEPVTQAIGAALDLRRPGAGLPGMEGVALPDIAVSVQSVTSLARGACSLAISRFLGAPPD